MGLTSSDIIQIDATVIIGLLILLTFQNVSSPVWEAELIEYQGEINRIFLEWNKLENLSNVCDNNPLFSYATFEDVETSLYLGEDFVLSQKFLDKCEGWKAEFQELQIEFFAFEDYAEERGFLESEDYYEFGDLQDALYRYTEQQSFFTIAMNIINLLMVTPFALSAIFEAGIAFRKKERDSKASKSGYLSMLIGFIGIIVGLVMIISIIITAF